MLYSQSDVVLPTKEKDLRRHEATTERVDSEAKLFKDSEPKHRWIARPSENNTGPDLPALQPQTNITRLPGDPASVCDAQPHLLGRPDPQGAQNLPREHGQGRPRVHEDFNTLGATLAPSLRRQDYYFHSNNTHDKKIVPCRIPTFNPQSGASMKRVEPDDPMELVGVVLPADAEAMREMAYAFAEEFVRMGYDKGQLLSVFQNPFYAGAHGAYRALGDTEIRTIIDECINVWGSIQFSILDFGREPQSNDFGFSIEEEGGGESKIGNPKSKMVEGRGGNGQGS